MGIDNLETTAPAHLRRVSLDLGDGARTTVHVAEYGLGQVELHVELLESPLPLERWCRRHGVEEALVGGFYVQRPQTRMDPALRGMPLGELRTRRGARDSIPFAAPWGSRRACVHVSGAGVRIARRDELAAELEGELLQAGPLLVRDGAVAPNEDEGFSAGSGQFDTDITVGRHPRAALGIDGERLIAVACDGRTEGEAGLTLEELAEALVDLGAAAALNLDGGGSTSLVCGGRLRNLPRDAEGGILDGGRAISSALVFARRS